MDAIVERLRSTFHARVQTALVDDIATSGRSLHDIVTLASILERLRVNEVMTWAVITVQPETELREAARIMYERKLGALPVAEGGRAVGMLTATDVIQALVSGAVG